MEDKVLKKFQTVKNEAFKDFESLGHSKKFIDIEYLAAKIAEGNLISLKDFIWHFYNKSILIFSRDFQKQAYNYWSMAVFDFRHEKKERVSKMKELSINARILDFQSKTSTINDYEVVINVSDNSCGVCLADRSKIYEVSKFLTEYTLPHRNCTCKGIGCTCMLSFVPKKNADGSFILNLDD
ncbi:hypothetical protein [Halpernia frigidisoli]|uniref:Uncharacterized protein n=1 Tax=Halpernia frigidisoli TaxID=1125876 RepID=A0A1I3E0E8_9FLAO|nr:hypothetical protein [Halpernia frigidisoli]SFH92373.1 hypothetical protein SAMN05443292_0804 [Halpernia frigidisoli]